MNFRLTRLAVFGLCAGPFLPHAPAQSEPAGPATPTVRVDSVEVLPAVSGWVDEGPLRYQALRVPRDAPPVPAPEHSRTGDATGWDSLAITLDRDSGGETTIELTASSLLREQWVEGRQPDSVDDESNYGGLASWDSDLVSISSSSFPWSTQCRVFLDDPDTGITYVCSGTMLDARTVLTAGHCVSKGYGNGWYTNFRVVPAWDGDEDAFGGASWSSATTFSGWHNNGDLNDDMGLIRLDRPFGFLTDWLGYSFATDDSFFSGLLFNAAGYPAGCYTDAPDQLYYGWGSYDDIQPGRLNADALWSCSTGGFSGTGSYNIHSSGARTLHGVHSTRCYSCDPDVIGHTRITQGKFDYIHNTYIPGGYSDTAPDYLPLDVNTDASITAGAPLSSMDYVLANSSTFNPFGTQAYTVQVYLSTNDNISTADTLIETHTVNWNFSSRDSTRVTLSTPPTIPADTPSGDYYLGIIISGSDDSNAGNDDSDGWDAAAIHVDGCTITQTQFGQGLAGSGGFVPELFGTGNNCQDGQHSTTITGALGGTFGFLWVGAASADLSPFFGGHFYIDLSSAWLTIPITLQGSIGVPGAGYLTLPGPDKSGLQGFKLYLQAILSDPGAVRNVSLSNGLEFAIDF